MMVDGHLYEYSLDSNEQILRMQKVDKNIIFALENSNGQNYSAIITSKQIKEVCKGFKAIKTLNEIVKILNKTIEEGNIYLAEDGKGASIELQFSIQVPSGNFPPFGILLQLNDQNSLNEEKLPAKFDYKGNIEVEQKYGNITNNTTEYNKPIVQPNYKKPIVQLEYIEPILQVHYPDGTTKSTKLPARIQTVDGQIPNIDEEQFKLIQQEMNRHMANQDIEGTGTSKYSMRTVPSKTDKKLKKKKKKNGSKVDDNIDKSKYSTFSVPAKPIVYPEQKYVKNATNPNNIVEYAPNAVNSSYSFAQPTIDFNKLINHSNTYNYSNNSYNYSNQYQNGYYTQNQYQNNLYSSYPQYYQNQMNNGFTDGIPSTQLQAQISDQKPTQKGQKIIKKNLKNQKILKNPKNQRPKNQKQLNKNKSPKDKEKAQTIEKKPENKSVEQNQEQNNNDIETVYRTEEGLIIFRNGILRGIIKKYAEIDNVVSRIQDIILKGAKFNLLYKATTHGDKASVFHEKCDNHQLTLVLVETTKGTRFGGFTTKTWDGHCLKKNDDHAFVFSIDENKIFDIILDQPAIGCYPKFGPVFFGCQIRIYNEFFTKGGTTCYRGLNYKTTKDYQLNNGEQTYIVKDIEVYEIEPIDV